jgi:hypothetical protein
MATKKPSKEELIRLAVIKLQRLNKSELENFIYRVNCCPHNKTRPCGMDSICNRCGAWI